MPHYRLFLLDRKNHVIGACERECDDGEVKLVALDVLRNESPTVDAVEVWAGTRRVAQFPRE